MAIRSVFLFTLAALASGAHAQSDPAPAPAGAPRQAASPQASAEDAADRVLVVGQRPGPGLWKVSKDDHVLWIFGLYGPLPKGMQWRSHEVEAILGRSQEYIAPPSASAKVGFLRSLALLPHAIGFKKLPGGAQLRDVLPADVYARWLPLKQKYLGDDGGVERERPLFAADTLFRKGLQSAGLSNDVEVRNEIEKLVKQKGLRTTRPTLSLEIDDPARMLKDFKKAQLDDVACFARTLDRLETDIDAMRVRADAWAKGDLAVIRKLNYADRDGACKDAILNSGFMQERAGLNTMVARAHELWLASVEKALAANASTFAALPLNEILEPKGLVAALRARGYAVQAPE